MMMLLLVKWIKHLSPTRKISRRTNVYELQTDIMPSPPLAPQKARRKGDWALC
jgi:hypothetical protein